MKKVQSWSKPHDNERQGHSHRLQVWRPVSTISKMVSVLLDVLYFATHPIWTAGWVLQVLLKYYQYYYYKPKTWAASTSLAHDLLAFASSGSTHLHISLSQSSHVLSFQSFVLWFNLNFHIQCCPPYSLTVFLLSFSQLLPLYHQSWLYCSSLYVARSLGNPKGKKYRVSQKKVVQSVFFWSYLTKD